MIGLIDIKGGWRPRIGIEKGEKMHWDMRDVVTHI